MPFSRRKTVFISGSAYEYGKWGDDGRSFIRDLSKTLIRNGFRIISGFGTGVGNYVVEGALHELYLGKKEKLNEHLQVFPFPAGVNGSAGTDQLQSIWEYYRNDIIAQAGIVLFVFGNKLQDITIREADGMWQEFEIARSGDTLLIPVGASGYTSERMWNLLVDRYDDYFESREKFDLYQRLGDRGIEPRCLIDIILQIAEQTPDTIETPS